MVYRMKLNDNAFEKMKAGIKKVELRLFDEKRSMLEIGDYIIFTNLTDEFKELAVHIMALCRYGSFEELFSEISLIDCGFIDGETVEEASVIMNRYYSDDEIRQNGVLGIKVQVIDMDEVIYEMEA